MTYEINYMAADRSITPAFSYDADAKELVPLSSRVGFNRGAGEFSITVNGDYPLLFDEEGLLVGDVVTGQRKDSFPRLDIIQIQSQGIRQRIASITQSGLLTVPNVTASSVFPDDSLNIMDLVAFDVNGVTATAINEVWFLADNGNYVCANDQFICVRL